MSSLTPAQIAAVSGSAPAEITKLELIGMGLQDISEIACCHALEKLSVDSNQLVNFAGVEELPELQTLSAQNNKLAALDRLRSLPKLAILNVSNNALTTLGTAMRDLTGLKVLLATDNSLRRLDLHLLKKLEQLTTIVASRNKIAELNGAEKLVQLRKLSLSHNELRTLGALPSTLVELRLAHNNLAVLPASLGSCARLTVLDIGSNQLNSLDQLSVLKGLERLRNLTARGNPVCSVLGDGYRVKTKQALPQVALLDGVKLSLYGGVQVNRKIRFAEESGAPAGGGAPSTHVPSAPKRAGPATGAGAGAGGTKRKRHSRTPSAADEPPDLEGQQPPKATKVAKSARAANAVPLDLDTSATPLPPAMPDSGILGVEVVSRAQGAATTLSDLQQLSLPGAGFEKW